MYLGPKLELKFLYWCWFYVFLDFILFCGFTKVRAIFIFRDYVIEESLKNLFFLEKLGIEKILSQVLLHFPWDLEYLQIYALRNSTYLFLFPFQLVYIKLKRAACLQVLLQIGKLVLEGHKSHISFNLQDSTFIFSQDPTMKNYN